MLKLSLNQLVQNHWRAVLLGTASVTLSACVATDTGSSSSTVSSSSVAVQPSSSSQAVSSSVEASSSVAPSSSSVAPISSSSSIAPSSSSVASSSAESCEEPDTSQFDRGMTVYGTDCAACHGQPVAGKTTGGLLAEIVVDSPPYGKTNDNSLAGYIISNMSNHLNSCTNSDSECAADIEHYLMIATGQLAIAQAECSSSSEVSSSSSVPSSSIASSSSAPSGTCSDAAICEDFENDLGAWGTSGEVSLSTENVFEGSSALKVAAAGGGYNRNFISLDLANTGVQSNMYGRMMLNVNTPSGNGGDFVFVQAEGAPDSADSNAPAGTNVMYRYRVNGSNGNLMANYDTYNNAGSWSTDCWDHSTVKMPTNQWACLEWHFDADANELKFWLDGNELTELHVQGSGEGCLGTAENGEWQAPGQFETLHLGIEQYHNGVPARTMYIDDVKVDTQYIGCPDSLPPTSSSSANSSTPNTGGSSSSAPAAGAALSCDFSISQDGGYYFEVKPVTITNTGTTAVNNWSVDIELGSTTARNLQIYARNGVSDATLAGSVLTVSGPSLAAGASATLDFGMGFDNHKVGTPSCASEGESETSSSATSSTGSGASSSSGTPPNPGAGFIVENFESGTLNAVPSGWRTFVGYVPDSNNASSQVFVDNTRAYSGTKSLKVDGGAGPAQIVKAIPAGVDRVYMRAWVYMDRKMGNDPSDNHEHIFAIKQNENGSFSANAEVRVGQGKGHLGFNLVPDGDAISPTLEKWYTGPETPVNEWYCAEAAFITDTAYDELHFYVNGQLVNSVKSAADWHAPVGADWLTGDLGFAAFGWHSFSSHAVTMWMDDIVVSESPIGCE